MREATAELPAGDIPGVRAPVGSASLDVDRNALARGRATDGTMTKVTGSVWGQLLLVAASLHVGLELVVQLVVYPALADASASSPTTVRRVHQEHMRRMSIAVAPVYGLLAVASVGLVAVDPTPVAVACLGLVVATFVVTGVLAVPAHEGLVAEPDPARRAALHRRLARADRARLLLAATLLALAWLAV